MREVFLKAIIESPDDDAPRLIFADWLEEHGDTERAEFIRLQCALAKLQAGDPRVPQMRRREEELLARHSWEWAADFGWRVSEWQFVRGFVERVETSLETSADKIREVLHLGPVRHLRDTGRFGDFSGVVEALSDFRPLTGLEFWWLYAFEDSLVEQMLSSPHLGNLSTLVLTSLHLGNLSTLVDSTWRGMSPELLEVIAASPHLRRLRRLVLSCAADSGHQPRMTPRLMRQLVGSPNLAGLKELDLDWCSFTREVWEILLSAPWLRGLERIGLPDARVVTEQGEHAGYLSDMPEWRQRLAACAPRVDFARDWEDCAWGGILTWRGQSWAGLQQAHLFAMWQHVRRGDYGALEAAYRADCVRYAGEEVAAAIDAVPFDRWRRGLLPGLRRAVAAAGQEPKATSVFFRLRTDLGWRGELHVSGEALREPFAPYDSGSYFGPIASFEAPPLPEAGEMRQRHEQNGPLDPGGARHYLEARTVAAFGRCAGEVPSPVPVFIVFITAVFRVTVEG